MAVGAFFSKLAEGLLGFLLVENRATVHLNLPKSKWSTLTAPHSEGGVHVSSGMNTLSYGLDPALSQSTMMNGLDFTFVTHDGQGKELALRMNFTTSHPEYPEVATRMLSSSPGLVQAPAGTGSLQQSAGMKNIQLLVPVKPSAGHSALAEFLDRQVGTFSIQPVLDESRSQDAELDELHDPVAMTFHEGAAYIVDRSNHRILKIPPGKTKGEVFFGNGQGSGLDQLAWPSNIVFFGGQAYIADYGNNRVLEVKPGEAKGKMVFGHLEGPSDLAFFQGNAYIVERPKHRIMKVKLGATKGEVVFGGPEDSFPWDSFAGLSYPQQITFHEGRAYIVDQINSRILKWNPWTRQAHLFFGQKWSGDTLKQVSVPMSITFFQGFAYIADAMNHRVLKVRPGALEAEVFFKGTGYVSDITFFEGKAYVVQGGMSNRIMKMNPWQTFAAETFFGKHQPLLSPASYLQSLKIADGQAYVVDAGARRILKVMPGKPGGEVFFSAVGTEVCPRDVTFFEEDAYIVDSGCIGGGGRILKLTKGKTQETFFGGEKGWGMNQLNGPSSITFDFVDGTAYIVDSGNHRILSVMRGKKYGQLFFGQGKGKELNQLHEPEAITFFDGFAYIVDAANNRILKVVPGRKEGTVFFGKGVGSSTDQLNRPQSISFFEGSAYIVDGGNSRVLMVNPGESHGEVFLGQSATPRVGHLVDMTFSGRSAYVLDSGSIIPGQVGVRILEICRPERHLDQFKSFSLGETLRSCGHVKRQVHESSEVLYLDSCRVPLPEGVATKLPEMRFNIVGLNVANMSHVIMNVQTDQLTPPMLAPSRGREFAALLLAVAIPSLAAHASGKKSLHIGCLLYLLAMTVISMHLGFAKLPFDSADSPGLSVLFLFFGVAMPWSAVPLFLMASFNELTARAFTEYAPPISCAAGTAWELHLLTALLTAFCASLWALWAQRAPLEKSEALLKIPKAIHGCLPKVLQDLADKPRPGAKRLGSLVSWAHTSIGDRYLALTSILVMRACGYEYAWLSLLLLVGAMVLQNVAGALCILGTAKETVRHRYALLWSLTIPPWDLLDPELEQAGWCSTATRVVVQDVLQMAFQLHFTFSLYTNWVVVTALAVSLPFAIADTLYLVETRAGQQPNYRVLYL